MIRVKAIIKGEPDVPPLFRTMFFEEGSDEEIFTRSVMIVKEKIVRGLRLNMNESILLYSGYAVSEIQARRPSAEIELNARNILSQDSVLIGVAESLRQIIFEAAVDDLPTVRLVFNSPIQEACGQSTFSPRADFLCL